MAHHIWHQVEATLKNLKKKKVKCLCGESSRWVAQEFMDDPGDMAPEGTGYHYYECGACKVTVPSAVMDRLLKEEA